MLMFSDVFVIFDDLFCYGSVLEFIVVLEYYVEWECDVRKFRKMFVFEEQLMFESIIFFVLFSDYYEEY